MAEVDVTAGQRCRLRATAGLCADCRHLRLMSNGRTQFVRCDVARVRDDWPRYPTLPVRMCSAFEIVDLDDASLADSGSQGSGS